MGNENLKHRLLEVCYNQVHEKIDIYKKAMEAAQNAANSESKSSAGDKYETTRALMQIEKDNNARQLAATLKLKQALDQINPEVPSDRSDFGSIVITDAQKYFISISAGILTIDGDQFIALSPSSPLGRQLMGLEKNDNLVFNGQQQKVLEIH